jgi:hypothetical protein
VNYENELWVMKFRLETLTLLLRNLFLALIFITDNK